MNSISSVKSYKSKCESPKTPGGISISLLTPCRRVGLSKRWKKSSPLSISSPLSTISTTPPVTSDKPVSSKRKIARKVIDEVENETDDLQDTPPTKTKTPTYEDKEEKTTSPTATPKRQLSIVNESTEKQIIVTPLKNVKGEEKSSVSKLLKSKSDKENDEAVKVAIPTRKKSSKKLIEAPKKDSESAPQDINNSTIPAGTSKANPPKPKSPNELAKECIVVLQKRIFKDKVKLDEKTNVASQVLFDSDSDDVPLSAINKIDQKEVQKRERPPDEDDFCEKITKVKKVDKNTSVTDLKQIIREKKKKVKDDIIKQPVLNPTPDSEDCDDDDDFDCRKTILIRKTYNKVVKPVKAKSTGSITQKDIDDLKRRIQVKKNMLLANTLTEDTEELRTLIKKWKKGCQDALTELMDLMKSKCPEKKYMEYSELLGMLKIPTSLVGYDSSNDCFITPDDASVVLSKFQ